MIDLPYTVSTLVSSMAYINFCFSQKRSYSVVVRGTYLRLRTSLKSCAHAMVVNVQCHWSLFFLSFKVGKAEKSRFILRLNKSKEEEVVVTDNGDGVTGGGLVHIESTELNLCICVRSVLNSSKILLMTESQSLPMGSYILLQWFT
jgi:hypothetical protein